MDISYMSKSFHSNQNYNDKTNYASGCCNLQVIFACLTNGIPMGVGDPMARIDIN